MSLSSFNAQSVATPPPTIDALAVLCEAEVALLGALDDVEAAAEELAPAEAATLRAESTRIVKGIVERLRREHG